MQNRRKQLSEFLNKLYQLEKELDALNDFAYTLSEQYNKNIFPEQEELSTSKLENLITSATHEAASQIGFYRNSIETLAKYIEFREQYAAFSDEELSQIIDSDLSIEVKQRFSSHFDGIKDMLTQLSALRHNWNQTFENKSYFRIKKQLRV